MPKAGGVVRPVNEDERAVEDRLWAGYLAFYKTLLPHDWWAAQVHRPMSMMLPNPPGVKALVFDVFGTVVDWRTSLIADFTAWSARRGVSGDRAGLVDAWRQAYKPSMGEVRRDPARWFKMLDTLHRQSLEKLVAQFGIEGLNDDNLDYMTKGWHRLRPWPDVVSGLTRLKTKFIIGTLSNGNVGLLIRMAKNAGLPWDIVLSAELFEHYKPDREVYIGAARLLNLPPAEVMLVAAHNNDLAAARSFGLKTGFVTRPAEYGPLQKQDFKAEHEWDIVARDFGVVADRLGC